MYGQNYLGYIKLFSLKNMSPEFYILNEKELLAVRWFINQDVDGKQFTAKVTCLIHPNGKIIFYYDNIPPEIKGVEWKPKIGGEFSCEGNKTVSEIITPETWINSGTLLEYEAVRNYCPKYTSLKACQRATTLDITCFWCDEANICIDDTDQDAHNMKVNNCRAKNMTTEENLEKKSSRYLYIVIPLIIFLFVVCVVFIMWRWLHKRNRSEE